MRDWTDKFFEDATGFMGARHLKSSASMRRIFTRVSKDFNLETGDPKRLRSLALIIFCAVEDDETDDEVFEIAHRWMSYISHFNLDSPFS